MNAIQIAKRVCGTALLSAVVLATAGMNADAQQSFEYRRPVTSGMPKLGFYGHIVYGQGLMVDSVSWATEAARIGLEPGDVIVSVNGRPIRSWSDYNAAMYYSGGRGRLVIRDVRSGWTVPANFALNNGRGPSSYAYEHR